MSGSSTANWWQYARWTNNVSRNMHVTNPEGAVLTAVRTFLKSVWNPQTQTGTRNWLQDRFVRKAVTGNYSCDIDVEPAYVVVELLNVVGRDFGKTPVTDFEKTLVDTLITATGNRRYGTGPYFGGVAGSTVTVP